MTSPGHRIVNVALLILICCLGTSSCTAFGVHHLSSEHTVRTSNSHGIRLEAAVETQTKEEQASLAAPKRSASGTSSQKKNDDRCLTFLAEFATDSTPVPSSTPKEAIDYFRNPKHLSFGASMPSSRTKPTPQLMQNWKEACVRVGAKTPTDRDIILNVRTVGISIPGLTIEWSAYLGVKLRRQSNGYPIFEFVLIQDELCAKGLTPVTYIFDRITGSRNGKQNKDSARKSDFFSTIGMQRNGDSNVFRCEGFIEINFPIPPLLFRWIGEDKQASEERMGKTIGNAIKKDMKKALRTWEETYIEWSQQRSQQQQHQY
eukprot:CAMPEP_0198121804 /NCGR_PEP_ID=MMETSP1442-20131203/33105_1 /TAXON_ID= /ORGANISM="Craspedostauros australis, Strain CCMP3328" /LENGTH=316 /DNA_ID=CAMNT_0043780681 /DNA_START=171 /DNA_END=1121 /DNA_ORIENTATION=+